MRFTGEMYQYTPKGRQKRKTVQKNGKTNSEHKSWRWNSLMCHSLTHNNADNNVFSFYVNNREIRILSPKSAEELHGITTKDYYKLLVVRHPFQRLVSAYRDRIEDTSRFTSQAWIYVPRIFALTRPSLNQSQIFDINSHPHKLSTVPTFQEFVAWLLVTPPKKYDVHWNRYSDQCEPCSVHYDAIIKMDNFSNEVEVSVMCKMGLQHLNVSLPHLQRTSGGPTDFHVSCQYFQQLIPEQVKELYAIYKTDFEMFHYSPQLYINCAQNNSVVRDVSVPNAAS
jgi:hypothetical protein